MSLDDKVLEQTPLEDRRLFQLGGPLDALMLAHGSVAALFGDVDVQTGAQVLRLDHADLW